MVEQVYKVKTINMWVNSSFAIENCKESNIINQKIRDKTTEVIYGVDKWYTTTNGVLKSYL